MTKEEFASLLNGREIGSEMSQADEALAKKHELIVIFGASDDLVELRGTIHDEISAYDGTTLLLNRKGVVEVPDEDDQEVLERFGVLEAALKSGAEIKAKWCEVGDYAWAYETAIPHATFDIYEDEEPWCRGIVISAEDLPQ